MHPGASDHRTEIMFHESGKCESGTVSSRRPVGCQNQRQPRRDLPSLLACLFIAPVSITRFFR